MNLLVVPPLANFLGLLLGLVLLRWRRRLGLWTLGISLATLVLFATPVTGALLLVSLQRHPALPATGPLPPVDAIVVLGADQEVFAPEYGGSTLGGLSLERLRYAAHLAHRSDLPVLVTAGVLRPGLPPLGEVMGEVLRDEFDVEPQWIEARSRNTFGNARFSAEILHAADCPRILLVTHAWHMPRALRVFQGQGLEVIPAPMGFRVRPRPSTGDFMPSAKGLQQSAHALHEYLGDLWYRLLGK